LTDELVIVVHVVHAVNGVQRFSLFKKGETGKREKDRDTERDREREREEREREREREGDRVKEKEKETGVGSFRKGLKFEIGNCLCKKCFFLLLVPGSPQEKFATILNLGN
jgi:Ni/Co efflux regulator RcnB